MNPKNYKTFRKGIAEKVGVHSDLVDEFVDFYYSKIRKNLAELSNPSISVFGLGMFNLRKNKVEQKITRNKKYLEQLEKENYKDFEKSVAVEEKIKMLEVAKSQVEELQKERKIFKAKKK
mgnify:CR=1 FL=1